MAVAFPNTSNDFSLGTNATSFTLAPPANKADGDLLIAIASGRFAAASGGVPSGWNTLVTNYQSSGVSGSIGFTSVYCMAIPTASALPANWAWSNSDARWSVIILRVTGVNISNPITASGTFTATSDSTHIPVGSVSSGGAAFMSGTSYFNEAGNDPANSTINGWSLLQNYGMTSAQAGRQSCVTYGGPDNGAGATTAFTLDITTSGQWNLSNETTGQAAVIVLGLNAAAGSPPAPGLLKAGII